jgi:phage gp16-like protein
VTLDRKRLSVIHVAKTRLRLTDDDYRAILQQVAGVASARDLEFIGFDKLMQHFARLGFKSTWTARTFGNRPGMATPSQVDMIRAMWREWADSSDDASLNHWLERICKVSSIRFLDREGAGKAINGLRAMVARKRSRHVAQPGGDNAA